MTWPGDGAPRTGGDEAANPSDPQRAHGLRSALGLLTVVGGSQPASTGAARWFPLVGAGIGSILGVTWWAARLVLAPLAAAAIVVALDLVLTGMLHFDGLLDAADGLLPPLDRQRRLAVMSEPSVGAFGIVVAVMVVVARFAALASITSAEGLWDPVLLLGGLWALSRSEMTFAMGRLPHARASGGLPGLFGAPARRIALAGAGGALAALVALVAWGGLLGVAAWVASVVAATAVFALSQRRIGGYTGDVLGAAGVLAETVALLIATGRR